MYYYVYICKDIQDRYRYTEYIFIDILYSVKGVYSLTERQSPLCCNQESDSIPSERQTVAVSPLLYPREWQYPLCCNPESGSIPSVVTQRVAVTPLLKPTE